MKILYKFASRERPEKFVAALDNIISLSKHDDYLILCSLDTDDLSMNNEPVKERINLYRGKVKVVWGISANKVHAINRDLEMVDGFEIICNHSDDMVFIKNGFDLDILEAFNDYDGFVHFPDQKALDRVCTYSMMSYNYFKLFNYIYNPAYVSVYCDNEATQVARILGKYKFVDKQILQHRHAIWGYGEADSLLKKTEHPLTYNRDRNTFLLRQQNNFFIDAIVHPDTVNH